MTGHGPMWSSRGTMDVSATELIVGPLRRPGLGKTKIPKSTGGMVPACSYPGSPCSGSVFWTLPSDRLAGVLTTITVTGSHKAGLELYVSHRAMVWHHKGSGGLSAEVVYGGRREWLRKGLKQVKEDVETKYGSRRRNVISLIATNPFRRSMVS